MGVDLGTQSIKVIIYDFENKKIISTKSQSYELISKEDGSMEQQASWWIDGFEKCLENIDDKDSVLKEFKNLKEMSDFMKLFDFYKLKP